MIAIAAVSSNWIIGKDGRLPWSSQKDDLKFFQEITLNKSIIVGRKTFESLPKLKDRYIYVLTSQDLESDIEDDFEFFNFKDYGKRYLNKVFKDCIVCGGATIYKEFLPKCDSLYLTKFDFECEGDTYFPFRDEDLDLLFPSKILVKEIDKGKIFHYTK